MQHSFFCHCPFTHDELIITDRDKSNGCYRRSISCRIKPRIAALPAKLLTCRVATDIFAVFNRLSKGVRRGRFNP